MFWPDTTEEKARAYLRHELWRIRKALSAQSNVDYLIADHINVSFNSSTDYWLDVVEIKSAVDGAAIDELMKALSGIQGELLPGFYENWITEEREHLHTLHEQSLSRLLELLEKDQRWQDMLEWAEKWISFDSVSEAAYRA
jgi:DNA-binding SARP family transcriptional activator